MSPFSAPVLGGAAVLSSPALWSCLVAGTTPLADGLLRYIAAVAVCWIGLSVVVALVGPAPRSAASAQQAAPTGRTATGENRASGDRASGDRAA